MNIVKWAQSIRKARESPAPYFRQFDWGSQCATASGLPRTCNERRVGDAQRPLRWLGRP